MNSGLVRLMLAFTIGIAGCAERAPGTNENSGLGSSNGGRMTVEPKVHRLGRIPGGIGKTIQVLTKLKNDGDAPLHIGDIVASCDCTKASLSRSDLAPGESASLISHIKLGESQEPRSSRIMIRSSDTQSPLTQVVFEWQTENPLITPEPTLNFLDLPISGTKTASIPINSRSLSLCSKCRIELDFDSKTMRCEWLLNPNAVRADHDEKKRPSSEVHFGELKLELIPRSDNEQLSRTISVSLICDATPRARLAIPVRWSFIPPLQWTPSRLFLGNRAPGERVEKEIFVKASQNEKLRLISVTCTDPSATIDSKLPESPISQGFVSFRLTIPSKSGPWTETLVLKTDLNDAAEIRIPISCVIGEQREN